VVVVHYPFHPLHGQELRVFVSARSPDGTVTVHDAGDKRLKIPLWMVAPNAANSKLADRPTLDGRALLRLVELWELHCGKLLGKEVHLPMEANHDATLVDQATGK
jgi:hypothetical protein